MIYPGNIDNRFCPVNIERMPQTPKADPSMDPIVGPPKYSAFVGAVKLVSGDIRSVLRAVKSDADEGGEATLLIFDDATGRQVELDLRGTLDEALVRLDSDPDFASSAPPEPILRGPGRPKLGVVSREVTLLPRHWTWLDQQSGGASSTLRKLVEHASKAGQAEAQARNARDATWRFMNAMAGNLPNFEEATRSLYQGDHERLRSLIKKWPKDIRNHTETMLARATA
jgi:uncharacterized protein